MLHRIFYQLKCNIGSCIVPRKKFILSEPLLRSFSSYFYGIYEDTKASEDSPERDVLSENRQAAL